MPSQDAEVLGDAVHEFLRRHLPAPTSTIRSIGAGLDHAAYLVDDAFVLRIASDDGSPHELAREQALLDQVGPRLPVAVPRPVGVSSDGRLALYTHIAGVSLLDDPSCQVDELPEVLAQVLSVLHATPTAEVEGLVPTDTTAPVEWQDEALEHLDRLGPVLAPTDASALRALVQDPPPASGRLVLAHADLGAEHLIAAGSPRRLVGIIDWSDASLTDPAVDLGRIFRDLGPTTLSRITAEYEGEWSPSVRACTHFYASCALVEDMVHGLTTGDRRYVDAARRHLRHVVDGPDTPRDQGR